MLNKYNVTNLKDLLNKYADTKITAKEVITSNNQYPRYLTLLDSLQYTHIIHNLDSLLYKLNLARELYGKPMIISSGFRPLQHNKQVGGVNNSLHTIGSAVDIQDRNGDIDMFFIQNIKWLKQHFCAIEHPAYTKNWCHFQSKLPYSKKNIYIPYIGPIRPEVFDNKWAG